jgi:hypothetical protein
VKNSKIIIRTALLIKQQLPCKLICLTFKAPRTEEGMFNHKVVAPSLCGEGHALGAMSIKVTFLFAIV